VCRQFIRLAGIEFAENLRAKMYALSVIEPWLRKWEVPSAWDEGDEDFTRGPNHFGIFSFSYSTVGTSFSADIRQELYLLRYADFNIVTCNS